jgi:hypothetical protein
MNFSTVRNAEVLVPPGPRISQPIAYAEGRLPQGTFSFRATLLIYRVSQKKSNASWLNRISTPREASVAERSEP